MNTTGAANGKLQALDEQFSWRAFAESRSKKHPQKVPSITHHCPEGNIKALSQFAPFTDIYCSALQTEALFAFRGEKAS